MATAITEIPRRVVLGRESELTIGDLLVTPSMRRVCRGDNCRTLDPRVMQVLVVLAQASGNVVSRDELIERCWEGRIVGDGAIHRVISVLRRFAAEFGQGAFVIETVARVGYALKKATPAVREVGDTPSCERGRPRRRELLLGAGAMTALAGTYGWWSGALSPRRLRARRLYRAGLESERRPDAYSITQAIRYYEQAVEADRSYSEAHGALARSLCQLAKASDETRLDSLTERVFATASAALRLDSNNRDALIARVDASPAFRRWGITLALARDVLARHPDLVAVRAKLGFTLEQAGFLREALAVAEQVVWREPWVPNYQLRLAWLLWQTGDTHRAQQIYASAIKTWPLHKQVATHQAIFLTLSGSADYAVSFIHEARSILNGGPLPAAIASISARALAAGSEEVRGEAIEAIVASRRGGGMGSFIAIPLLAGLGGISQAFHQCDGYFLRPINVRTGRHISSPRYAERWSSSLFGVATTNLRSDPRFESLMAEIGLKRFWRMAGIRPDYLRG